MAERVPELSRTRIQELIREGHVHVDGKIAKVSHRVAAGERIEVQVLPRPALVAEPEDLPLELLLVDDDFVIVNKPAGIVVHAGAGHARGTLVNALLHRLGKLSGAGGALRPGIVHRLDRETSGAMVVARNDKAHEHLAEQFRSRNVRKIYLALVHGKMPRDSGTITLPISRDPHRRTYGAPRGLRAGTRNVPLLERNFLHAARIGFSHPSSGAWVEVRAPLPGDLRVYFEQSAATFGWREADIDAALAPYK